jgi:hypothetical protein
MALVDIDEGLKKEIDDLIAEFPIDFPTIKHFCNLAIRRHLARTKKELEEKKGD